MCKSSWEIMDKIAGMFMGCFLGDSLGAPHEFKCCKDNIYTGKMEHSTFYISRFQGRRDLSVGQVTDDSEMTLALLRTLITDGKYIRNNVISSYLNWANSGGWMIGTNTRKLLRGVKTIKGYENRIAKIKALPLEEISQSNGFMMRASPLALLKDNESVIEDICITNPHPVCIDCGLIYVNILRMSLAGINRQTIFSDSHQLARTQEVKNVFEQIMRNEPRNIEEKKGWCLHALWCSLVCLLYFNNFQEGINWVIKQGGDTDTNGCIAGAVLGSTYGFDQMLNNDLTKYNIAKVLEFKSEDVTNPTPRPKEYSPRDFFQFIPKAYNLTL